MMIKRVASWFLWAVMALVVVALVGYWWRYGRSEKANFKLPSDANLLISIDLRQMEKTVFWDALSHPMSYWDDSDSDDDNDGHKPSQGMSIPKQVAFFLLNGHDDVLFSQPISVKEKDFVQYADTLVGRQKWEAIDSQFVFDNENHLFYLWDGGKVGVAFAKRNDADFVQKTIVRILKGDHCFSMPDYLSEKINLGEHHFVIWRKPSKLTNNEPAILYGDFEKGSMVIQGEVPFQYSFSRENNYVRSTSNAEGDVLNLSLNLGDNHFAFSDAFSQDFQKKTHLALDSLLMYSTKSLTLIVPHVASKVDSIITYEYDDDFNKIEKVSTQKIIEPQVVAYLESKEQGQLYAYFKRRGVVKDIDGVSRFVGLPFVEMKAIPKGRELILSTQDSIVLETKQDTSFFKLKIGCSRYPEMFGYFPFQLDSAHVALFDELEISARQLSNTSNIKIQARLNFKNKTRNVLGLLAIQ